MKIKIVVVSCILMWFLAMVPATAAEKFEEDQHYFTIFPEQPGGEGDRIQVLEFFWYACPHCYDLEPHLDAWLKNKPDNIDFQRVPAMFSRADIVLHAKTYYALRLMGVADKLHAKIFHAVHDQNKRLKDQPEMEAFLSEQGVDIEAYRKAMKSFPVNTQARRAAVLAENFDVQGVPAMVVDGKYRVGGLHGDVMMEVTDYLIGRVEREKGAGQQ